MRSAPQSRLSAVMRSIKATRSGARRGSRGAVEVPRETLTILPRRGKGQRTIRRQLSARLGADTRATTSMCYGRLSIKEPP
jgi:hypothetical protein